MSPLLAFYTGVAPDSRGRTLADILAWPDNRLEVIHDYIQWLFPLPEASTFNPAAPLLTDADIAAFHDQPAVHQALATSLARMRLFYGLPGDRVRQANWITPGNHNYLRLTRILRSLHLLGHDDAARALLRELEALFKAGAGASIGAPTLGYWRRAAE